MTDSNQSAAPASGHVPEVPSGAQPTSAETLRLTQALTERFAPHVEGAAAAVREAALALTAAQEELARARHEAENQRYRSDPLVFMRSALPDEVEALARKTTPKKVQAAYRYMLARAVELAAGEVQGYHADQTAIDLERTHGVDAGLHAEQAAAQRLEAAREMQQRVQEAELAARAGLATMIEKGMATD